MQSIPCTVGMLTYNSGATLRRALMSVRSFSDIVICDGGSTDDTLAIAAEFGARVIAQDPRYLEVGRIRDFSGVRNQLLAAANEPWYFWLDSDEYIDEALAREIEAVIQAGEPHAYWIPRLYVYEGEVIERAVTYPTQQMRFFHTSLVRGFIKPIHERLDLSVAPLRLHHPMYVPVPETVADMKRKWLHYLSIERDRLRAMPMPRKLKAALRESAVGCLYAVRIIRNRLFGSGRQLPLPYETARLWYQARLVAALFV